MELNNIHVGMKCGSKKGSGTVACVDEATRTIYMETTDNNILPIDLDDIIQDPQVHNREDTFY